MLSQQQTKEEVTTQIEQELSDLLTEFAIIIEQKYQYFAKTELMLTLIKITKSCEIIKKAFRCIIASFLLLEKITFPE